MSRPLVSVCVTTYNHRNFIAEALESVLNQKTNFDFELLVGEDDSSDGTREICQAYAKKCPEKIRLFLRSRKDVIYKNGKPTGRYNFSETIKAANGKYIALLEGDDFWSDENKLQKQVAVLESQPGIIMCHHWQNLAVMNAAGKFEIKAGNKEGHGYFNQPVSDVSEIFRFRMRPQTRTLMFRNIFKDTSFPLWFYRVQFGDLALSFILGMQGKFYFIDEEMAVYRVTPSGASSIFSDQKGYLTGNKAWMEIWAYALKMHRYKYISEALQGMSVFINRIKTASQNSISERLKLMWFVLTGLQLKFFVKRRLIQIINSNKQAI
jgi:glycosyltransferase involved in cell wall biosynthesis